MSEQGVYMKKREIDRLNLCQKVHEKRMSKILAARELKVSYRQFLRIYGMWEQHGVSALPHKSLGKPGNRKLSKIHKAQTLEIITLPQYQGFKPTFMCEKLYELHGINVSKETLRQWMIEEGVWEAKCTKAKSPVHQRRLRRARYGELLQIDGSPHAWFEERGDPCSLLVFIDDATGTTTGKFYPQETALAYMDLLHKYIKDHGKPLALYSDKFSVFRVNRPGCLKKELITQFGRICKDLEVELICANSPQAKGRVERMNQTLQDRLIKEMRLKGIKNIEEGNRFLEEYWPVHNNKFCVPPRCSINAHRKVFLEQNIENVICIKESRVLTKNLEFQYNKSGSSALLVLH